MPIHSRYIAGQGIDTSQQYASNTGTRNLCPHEVLSKGCTARGHHASPINMMNVKDTVDTDPYR